MIETRLEFRISEAQGKLALGFGESSCLWEYAMPIETPWNDWYHCNGNTYGTWLPGDPRGFRTRHHRGHVEGDYKNRPPPGSNRELLERSQTLLQRAPIHLNAAQQKIAADAVVEKMLADGIEIIALSVDDHHFHLLSRFRDHRPKHWVGRAKMHSSMILRDHGLPGGAWATGCRTLPIHDRQHQVTVFDYIVKHHQQGAAVWTFRDGPPRPARNTPRKPIATPSPKPVATPPQKPVASTPPKPVASLPRVADGNSTST